MADKNLIQDYLINQSPATVTLKKALDAQAMRQRAHAQNIANAETPGYKRVAVDFEQQLKEMIDQSGSGVIKTSDKRHLGTGTIPISDLNATLREEPLAADNPGINGVDIEKEMAEMAETQLRYLASLELLKRRYSAMKSAIKGQ